MFESPTVLFGLFMYRVSFVYIRSRGALLHGMLAACAFLVLFGGASGGQGHWVRGASANEEGMSLMFWWSHCLACVRA